MKEDPDAHCQKPSVPDYWTSESADDRAHAVILCRTRCGAFLRCREYAAQHRWFAGIVIAGWQAPKTKQVVVYPPWKDSP